jgi:flagellar hook-length control protein FliK
MMDLAIALNLSSQPKTADIAADSAFSDDSPSFAEVLEQELMAEQDSAQLSAQSLAEDAVANAGTLSVSAEQAGLLPLTTEQAAADPAWLTGDLQPGAAEQPMAGNLPAEPLAAGRGADTNGQEVAAASGTGHPLYAASVAGIAASQVSAALNTNRQSAADAGSGMAANGPLSADELVYIDPVTGKQYRSLPEFNHAGQAEAGQQGVAQAKERPHLLDLIGRARDFKPTAQEQAVQTGVTAGSAGQLTDKSHTGANTLETAGISGLAVTDELSTGQTGKNAVAGTDSLVPANKLSLSANTAGSVQLTAAWSDTSASLSLSQAQLTAGEPAVDTEQISSFIPADSPQKQSDGGTGLQRNATVISGPAAQASLAAQSDSFAGQPAADTLQAEITLTSGQQAEVGGSEPATKKTNSFAEHMRQVNQQLKVQADSPAQQQNAGTDAQPQDQQHKEQQAAPQQGLASVSPGSATLPAAGTGNAASFASVLATEQPASTPVSAAGHSQLTNTANSAALPGRTTAEFNAPLQLYEQQAAAQLKEKVLYQVSNKIQSAEIRLNPEELGSVQIKLNLQQDQLNLQFIVSQPQAKEALEQQMPRLRELLEQQGLALADSHVEQRSSQQQEQGQSRQFSGSQNSHNGNGQESVSSAKAAKAADRLVDYYA